MDNATADLDADVFDNLTYQEIKPLVSGFIAKLSPCEIASIYWSGARLWMDSKFPELRLTIGPPDDRRAHPDMNERAALGHWVWTGLGGDYADEHPVDEEGERVDEWPELVDWMYESLAYAADYIAEELKTAADRAEEAE